MADSNSSIFTQKATEKLRSPDDLDEYVRVTNPSVWVVLSACIALLIGLFAWGFLGTAETSVAASGTYVKGDVVCFLPADKAANVHPGDTANVNGKLLKVASVSAVPISRIEAREMVESDYLASTLVQDDWAYVVLFEDSAEEASFQEGVPVPVTITTARVAPISLIFKDLA